MAWIVSTTLHGRYYSMPDNPIWYKELGNGNAIELELVMGGINFYVSSNEDSILAVLSKVETKELALWMKNHIDITSE